MTPRDPRLGIVVIGRNEGPRLRDALEALVGRAGHCVYVDSGSTDGSLELAGSFGAQVEAVALDGSRAFSAARGRNTGFECLARRLPELAHVQFVDGDCVLSEGWLETACAFLDANADVAAVAGRLREEDRARNRYHRLADMEWDHPAGDVATTGGIALIRASAFQDAGGFDGAVPAGEELELATRLRQLGYRIVRLDADMARHDIDMQSFLQWWRRTVRGGHSSAEAAYREGFGDSSKLREVLSVCAYGGALPAAATALALPTLGASLSLYASYPLLWLRVRDWRRNRGDSPDDAALYASATLVGKFANAVGVARFGWRVLRGKRVRHERQGLQEQ